MPSLDAVVPLDATPPDAPPLEASAPRGRPVGTLEFPLGPSLDPAQQRALVAMPEANPAPPWRPRRASILTASVQWLLRHGYVDPRGRPYVTARIRHYEGTFEARGWRVPAERGGSLFLSWGGTLYTPLAWGPEASLARDVALAQERRSAQSFEGPRPYDLWASAFSRDTWAFALLTGAVRDDVDPLEPLPGRRSEVRLEARALLLRTQHFWSRLYALQSRASQAFGLAEYADALRAALQTRALCEAAAAEEPLARFTGEGSVCELNEDLARDAARRLARGPAPPRPPEDTLAGWLYSLEELGEGRRSGLLELGFNVRSAPSDEDLASADALRLLLDAYEHDERLTRTVWTEFVSHPPPLRMVPVHRVLAAVLSRRLGFVFEETLVDPQRRSAESRGARALRAQQLRRELARYSAPR